MPRGSPIIERRPLLGGPPPMHPRASTPVLRPISVVPGRPNHATTLPLLAILLAGCVDLRVPSVLETCASSEGCPADAGRFDGPAAPEAGIDSAADMPSEEVPETGLDAPTDGAETETPADGPGTPIDALVMPPAPLINGASCESPARCASGFCVDGVCCDEACVGSCRSCARPGTAGVCTPAPDGEDPDDDCEQDPPSSCGRDGACDGRGGCRRHPAGTPCAPGSCLGSTEYAARTCDGAGVCRPATMKSCAPYTCGAQGCRSSCDSTGGCVGGSFCASGACTGRLANGAPCTDGAQCNSGFCADGLCCETACAAACHACNLPGSPGACIPAPAGQDPRQECAPEAAATCGRDGECDGSGACRRWPAGTACAGATCTDGTFVPARSCNGAGTCAAAAPVSCQGFTCAGPACRTQCTVSSECTAGRTCLGASCVRFGYRRALTIDRNKVGAAGTTAQALVDYPVLVVLTLPDLRNKASGGKVERSNGEDLLFRGETAAVCGSDPPPCRLAHEIEGYAGATGTLVAWVRVPRLATRAAAADTVLHLYYGSPGVTAPLQAPTTVWDTGFEAVWHLRDNPTAPTPAIRDSTPHARHGRQNGMVAGDQVAGQIGGALNFDNVDNRIMFADFLENVPQMTVQAWALKRSLGDDRIVAKSDTYNLMSTTFLWSLGARDLDQRARIATGGMNALELQSPVQVPLGNWTFLAFTYDGAMLRLYQNGVNVAEVARSGLVNQGNSIVVVGSNDDGVNDRHWDGIIDEVRLSSVARSADWLATDFADQSAPSTFVVTGPEEALPP